MKKVSLRTQAWVVVVGRGLTVLLSALCMFLWVSAALKPLLTVTAVSCFVMVMFELCVFCQVKIPGFAKANSLVLPREFPGNCQINSLVLPRYFTRMRALRRR